MSETYQLQLYFILIVRFGVMRHNDNEQAKSPEGALKSNKNITSSVAFNLKT